MFYCYEFYKKFPFSESFCLLITCLGLWKIFLGNDSPGHVINFRTIWVWQRLLVKEVKSILVYMFGVFKTHVFWHWSSCVDDVSLSWTVHVMMLNKFVQCQQPYRLVEKRCFLICHWKQQYLQACLLLEANSSLTKGHGRAASGPEGGRHKTDLKTERNRPGAVQVQYVHLQPCYSGTLIRVFLSRLFTILQDLNYSSPTLYDHPLCFYTLLGTH